MAQVAVSKEKKGKGRPSTYDRSYCKKVIEWGKKGLAPVQWAVNLDVNKDTLLEWAKNNHDFSVAYKNGMDAREQWLLNQGMNRITGKNRFGSDSMIKFLLACNHGYREKIDVELSGSLETTSKVEVSFASLLQPTEPE